MKEKIIVYVIVILIFIFSCSYIYFNNKEYVIENTNSESIKKIISVDIKGAVVSPGVKQMEAGDTVNDLIEKSGGLSDNADTSIINLSKELTNEMVVIIYTKDEINEMKNGNTSVKIVDKECICPVIENDGCNDLPNFVEIENNSNKISLNNASKEELMTLTGIGETKADAIIEYRNNKKFETIEEITKVKGIGQSTFEKIKDNLTI